MSEITYEKRGDKYIFCKYGVYFGLTADQVGEMESCCHMIKRLGIDKYSPSSVLCNTGNSGGVDASPLQPSRGCSE